jgi:histone deacetylase 11
MGGTQSQEEREEPTPSEADTPGIYEIAELEPRQWPIVYSSQYNIGFMGLQRLHPFDSAKWGKIFDHLQEAGMIKGKEDILEPREITKRELQMVHTEEYLESLTSSMNVAMVVEVPPVAILPNFVVQNKLLRPFRFQTAGTIMAGKLAMERGWAINIGGGFHHCSSNSGGGFCAYADITLAVKYMFNHIDGVRKAMIVDFDAHQGNGHERDFLGDERVFILDMYNRLIYPGDNFAKQAIKRKVELNHHTTDQVYLENIRRHLPAVLDEFDPDVVVYNAGTDILEGDRLGNLDITPEGVIERDRLVFTEVRKKRGKPIFMLTSGGYQRNNARVIADSILGLHREKLISNPLEDSHITSELREQGASLAQGRK